MPRAPMAFALALASVAATTQAAEEGTNRTNSDEGCVVSMNVDNYWPGHQPPLDEDSKKDVAIAAVLLAVGAVCLCGLGAVAHRSNYVLTCEGAQCPKEAWLVVSGFLGCSTCITCGAAVVVLVRAFSCGDCEEGDTCERGTPLCVCEDDVSASMPHVAPAIDPVMVSLAGLFALVALVAVAAASRSTRGTAEDHGDVEREPLAIAAEDSTTTTNDKERATLSGEV